MSPINTKRATIGAVASGATTAGRSILKDYALPAAGGLAATALYDQLAYPKDPNPFSDYRRGTNTLLNLGLSAGGAYMMGHGSPTTGMAMLASPPVKDLALNAIVPVRNMGDAAKNMQHATNVGLGLGAGGLALGGLALAKYMSSKAKQDSPRVRVTLPTRNPHDNETVVDLPMSDSSFTPSMRMKMEQQVRRQVRHETRERALKRDPNTGKLIPLTEWNKLYAPNPEFQQGGDTMKMASTYEDMMLAMEKKAGMAGAARTAASMTPGASPSVLPDIPGAGGAGASSGGPASGMGPNGPLGPASGMGPNGPLGPMSIQGSPEDQAAAVQQQEEITGKIDEQAGQLDDVKSQHAELQAKLNQSELEKKHIENRLKGELAQAVHSHKQEAEQLKTQHGTELAKAHQEHAQQVAEAHHAMAEAQHGAEIEKQKASLQIESHKMQNDITAAANKAQNPTGVSPALESQLQQATSSVSKLAAFGIRIKSANGLSTGGTPKYPTTGVPQHGGGGFGYAPPTHIGDGRAIQPSNGLQGGSLQGSSIQSSGGLSGASGLQGAAGLQGGSLQGSSGLQGASGLQGSSLQPSTGLQPATSTQPSAAIQGASLQPSTGLQGATLQPAAGIQGSTTQASPPTYSPWAPSSSSKLAAYGIHIKGASTPPPAPVVPKSKPVNLTPVQHNTTTGSTTGTPVAGDGAGPAAQPTSAPAAPNLGAPPPVTPQPAAPVTNTTVTARIPDAPPAAPATPQPAGTPLSRDAHSLRGAIAGGVSNVVGTLGTAVHGLAGLLPGEMAKTFYDKTDPGKLADKTYNTLSGDKPKDFTRQSAPEPAPNHGPLPTVLPSPTGDPNWKSNVANNGVTQAKLDSTAATAAPAAPAATATANAAQAASATASDTPAPKIPAVGAPPTEGPSANSLKYREQLDAIHNQPYTPAVPQGGFTPKQMASNNAYAEEQAKVYPKAKPVQAADEVANYNQSIDNDAMRSMKIQNPARYNQAVERARTVYGGNQAIEMGNGTLPSPQVNNSPQEQALRNMPVQDLEKTTGRNLLTNGPVGPAGQGGSAEVPGTTYRVTGQRPATPQESLSGQVAKQGSWIMQGLGLLEKKAQMMKQAGPPAPATTSGAGTAPIAPPPKAPVPAMGGVPAASRQTQTPATTPTPAPVSAPRVEPGFAAADMPQYSGGNDAAQMQTTQAPDVPVYNAAIKDSIRPGYRPIDIAKEQILPAELKGKFNQEQWDKMDPTARAYNANTPSSQQHYNQANLKSNQVLNNRSFLSRFDELGENEANGGKGTVEMFGAGHDPNQSVLRNWVTRRGNSAANAMLGSAARTTTEANRADRYNDGLANQLGMSTGWLDDKWNRGTLGLRRLGNSMNIFDTQGHHDAETAKLNQEGKNFDTFDQASQAAGTDFNPLWHKYRGALPLAAGVGTLGIGGGGGLAAKGLSKFGPIASAIGLQGAADAMGAPKRPINVAAGNSVMNNRNGAPIAPTVPSTVPTDFVQQQQRSNMDPWGVGQSWDNGKQGSYESMVDMLERKMTKKANPLTPGSATTATPVPATAPKAPGAPTTPEPPVNPNYVSQSMQAGQTNGYFRPREFADQSANATNYGSNGLNTLFNVGVPISDMVMKMFGMGGLMPSAKHPMQGAQMAQYQPRSAQETLGEMGVNLPNT